MTQPAETPDAEQNTFTYGGMSHFYDAGEVTAELRVARVPLLEQAQELKGQKVIVYIAGGIQVDGKLVDVDDQDLVLTVDDRSHRHYIAIESIAVLAVER